MQATDNIPLATLALEKLLTKIKPGTSTHLKSAIVALFTADLHGILRYSNAIGLLQLDMDRLNKTKMLRLYDLESLTLLFESEIYYRFQECYRALSPSLYIFDYPRGSIAFLFRNSQQAQIMKMKIFSNCPPKEQYEEIKQKQLEELRKKEEKNTFFGKIKNFFGSNEEEQQKKQESEVLSWKKQQTIQINLSDGTFDTQNIPPEWQEIFDNLKLSKEDLNNKEVMGIIVEQTIMNQAKRQAEQESSKDLQKKIKEAEKQIREEQIEYQNDIKRNTAMNLPPPPPPPPPLLTPQNMRTSLRPNRANLLDEIRNNNVKLKHVEINNKNGKDQMTVDISDMNKQERSQLAQNLMRKLQMRKKALNRRSDSDDD